MKLKRGKAIENLLSSFVMAQLQVPSSVRERITVAVPNVSHF